MLSKPHGGWTTITIGDWSDRCSYLTDVPLELTDVLEQGVREHRPVVIKFDAEGWENIVVFDWLETHIITNKSGEFEFYSFPIGRDQLATELIADIREDLDGWACWMDFTRRHMSDDEFNERKATLRVYCDMIERRLPSDDWVIKYIKENDIDA